MKSTDAEALVGGQALSREARSLIPGGCHTYAKGDDQFPLNAPGFIARGNGCRVWDVDGREFIEYGMGMRAVTLGHAFPRVLAAVTAELGSGTNFTRPSPIEVTCARELLSIVPAGEMVKFAKDGSDTLDAAVRLARATTGRDLVAICQDHPFFSTSDWFIGTTDMAAGIPQAVRDLTVKFRYNDIDSLMALFRAHPTRIACVVLEGARTEEPVNGFLANLQEACRADGALLILDEMITGLRWNLGGAQAEFGLRPDLSTWGKALANGFSVSALVGRREVMERGGFDHDAERVFLLSTTHGAETHSLAAAIETIRCYKDLNVIDTLYARGRRLREGVESLSRSLGLENHVRLASRDCSLLYATLGPDGRPSQAFRTLFLQELIKGGVIAPSFVVSYSHSDRDIDLTLEAIERALHAYRRALENGVERVLEGRPSKPVFRRYP